MKPCSKFRAIIANLAPTVYRSIRMNAGIRQFFLFIFIYLWQTFYEMHRTQYLSKILQRGM